MLSYLHMKNLPLRLPDELYEALRRAAFEGHVPMNDIVRRALQQSEEVKAALAYNAQNKK